jgi:uncharacterized protein DUF3592
MGLDILIEFLVRVCIRCMKLLRSRNWPVIKATVVSAERKNASLAEIHYRYSLNGKSFAAVYKIPFFVVDAGDFARRFERGDELKVRVNPDDPSVSVLEDPGWPRRGQRTKR